MSLAHSIGAAGPRWRLAVDKLGVLLAIGFVVGALMPFAVFKANRIVLGEGMSLWTALPGFAAVALTGLIVCSAVVALLRLPPGFKLAVAGSTLAILLTMIGTSGSFLTPENNTYARVTPGGGFWVLAFTLTLMSADALVRLRLGAWQRIAILCCVLAAAAVLLATGAWDDLSILKEYSSRAGAFWQEARTHLILAFGSVAAAALIGIPLGVLCYKFGPLRASVLNVLNVLQTVPSIALFGLLIAPLAWVAANVPGASRMGISGIGMAPALVALFAYSLLPIVSNTLSGLVGVAPAAVEAARGMGMSWRQRLWRVELPLAFPVILTGIRIVLVQNIGLATIAALIGGGGFGVFVFQGIGQTAMDLVLLGAVPTVALAFAAAVILDALVELSGRKGGSA